MKKETLEEAAENWFMEQGFNIYNHYDTRPAFEEGAKWQQEQMYSDMQKYAIYAVECHITGLPFLNAKSWIEANKNK